VFLVTVTPWMKHHPKIKYISKNNNRPVMANTEKNLGSNFYYMHKIR